MSNVLLQQALTYASLEWYVIPIKSTIDGGDGKIPLIKSWTTKVSIEEEILIGWWTKWSNANIGIVTGQRSNLLVLDIDKSNGGFESLDKLIKTHGSLPNTLTSRTGGGGLHYLFKYPNLRINNSAAKIGDGIDIRGDGGQVIAPPSLHKSGNNYEWMDSNELSIDNLAELPKWLLDLLINHKKNPGEVKYFIPEGKRNDSLARIAGSYRGEGLNQGEIAILLHNTNIERCHPPLPDNEVDSIAISIARYPYNYKPTDDEFVAIFIENYPNTIFGLGNFRRYIDGVWEVISELVIKREILKILQIYKINNVKPSSAKVNSIFDLLKISVAVEKWESNPNALILLNGVFDLAELSFREHSPEDYAISKLPYIYEPNTNCLNWIKYLETTIPNEIGFLQEFAGYCLTTDTKYEKAVWLYGPRGSGKSTFIVGMETLLGNQAGVLSMKDIMQSRFSIANIVGKRLLCSTEHPPDRVVDTSKLNAIISGEKIMVERKYEQPFEYTPYAKIIWAMNQRPNIPNSGDGLLRRILFVEYPPLRVKPDPKLKERIKAEGSGIFNWAIQGL